MPQPALPAGQLTHLRRAVELAAAARAHGNHPFGAVIVTVGGMVVEAENTVVTTGDATGHAETNAVRAAASLSESERRGSTLYTSTEPCAMCAGAIFWSGIGRVVFALGEQELIAMAADTADTLDLPCREVFARGDRAVEVIGPVALPEAFAVHEGFWR